MGKLGDLFGMQHFKEDILPGGYRRRLERERLEKEVAEQEFNSALHDIPQAVAVWASGAIELSLEMVSSAMIMAIIQGSGVDVNLLNQYQLEQLEGITQGLVEEECASRSRLLDEATRDANRRKGETNQR